MPVNWKNKIRPNHFAVTTFNLQVFLKIFIIKNLTDFHKLVWIRA